MVGCKEVPYIFRFVLAKIAQVPQDRKGRHDLHPAS